MALTSSGKRSASPVLSSPDAHSRTSKRNVMGVHQAKNTQESDIWATGIYSSSAERILRTLVGPIVLLITLPVFVNLAALAAKEHDSNLVAVLTAAAADTSKVLQEAFPLPSLKVVLAVLFFIMMQLALFTLLPGKLFPGARSPSGFVPQVSLISLSPTALHLTNISIALRLASHFPSSQICSSLFSSSATGLLHLPSLARCFVLATSLTSSPESSSTTISWRS